MGWFERVFKQELTRTKRELKAEVEARQALEAGIDNRDEKIDALCVRLDAAEGRLTALEEQWATFEQVLNEVATETPCE